MRIGTTSFAFRYLLAEPALAPRLPELVELCARHGLGLLQICENARPLEAGSTQWMEALHLARASGLTLGVGMKTTSASTFHRYLSLAEKLDYRTLRIVFETDGGTAPSAGQLRAFLDGAVPACTVAGLRLAIENHFDIPSRLLAEVALDYPAGALGFCLDTANSLRNFESPEAVFDLLGPRALCYHVKDFEVLGHLLGFQVTGAPLGQGRLDLEGVIRRILAISPEPDLLVENWTPESGDRAADAAKDELWLALSLSALRQRVEALRPREAAV